MVLLLYHEAIRHLLELDGTPLTPVPFAWALAASLEKDDCSAASMNVVYTSPGPSFHRPPGIKTSSSRFFVGIFYSSSDCLRTIAHAYVLLHSGMYVERLLIGDLCQPPQPSGAFIFRCLLQTA